MATAAVSVILVSLVGVAAVTGVLPNSYSSPAGPPQATEKLVTGQPKLAAAQNISTGGTVQKKPLVHNNLSAPAEPVTQYSSGSSHSPVAPVAQNSPIGIGVGAVIGGLLGNQVGGGNGKTLATIAGAVGGGYVGNEVAKRNQ